MGGRHDPHYDRYHLDGHLPNFAQSLGLLREDDMTDTEYEQGFRHGKHDYCVGAVLLKFKKDSEYARGYRDGIEDSKTIVRNWLANELKSDGRTP
jgi:hypothetical protein